MIGMSKQIRFEVIVIPHKSVSKIIPCTVQSGFGEVATQDKAVKTMHENIDSHHARECIPPALLRIVMVVKAKQTITLCLFK